MKVYKLTFGQKTSLENVKFFDGMYFNPIQDADGNWIISESEISQCDVPSLSWVKTLDQIDYNPVIYIEEIIEE